MCKCVQGHACRSEDLEMARELDQKAAQAWVGHPYFDVVDNSTDFEAKVCRMIQVREIKVKVTINTLTPLAFVNVWIFFTISSRVFAKSLELMSVIGFKLTLVKSNSSSELHSRRTICFHLDFKISQLFMTICKRVSLKCKLDLGNAGKR